MARNRTNRRVFWYFLPIQKVQNYVKIFKYLTFYIKSGGGGIRTPVRTSSPLGHYKFSFAGYCKLSAKQHVYRWFVGLMPSKTNRARLAAFHGLTAFLSRMEDTKGAVD